MVALTQVRKRGRATPDRYESRLCHKPNLQLEGYYLHQLTSPYGERGYVYLRKPTFEQPRKQYESPYMHRTPLQARVSAVNEYHLDKQPFLNGKYFDLRLIRRQLHDLLCSVHSVSWQVQGTPYVHQFCFVDPEVYQSILCNRIIGLLLAFKALPDKRKDTEIGLSTLGVAVEYMRYISGLSMLVERLLKTQGSFALEMRTYACSHISQKVTGAVETIRTLRNPKTRAQQRLFPLLLRMISLQWGRGGFLLRQRLRQRDVIRSTTRHLGYLKVVLKPKALTLEAKVKECHFLWRMVAQDVGSTQFASFLAQINAEKHTQSLIDVLLECARRRVCYIGCHWFEHHLNKEAYQRLVEIDSYEWLMEISGC